MWAAVPNFTLQCCYGSRSFFFQQKLTRTRDFFSYFLFASTMCCQLGNTHSIDMCDSQIDFCAGAQLELCTSEGLLPIQGLSEIGHSRDKGLFIPKM